MFDKEMLKKMDLGSCCSMMTQFMNAGSKEEGAGKFDFKDCGEMMKQFCAGQDGKFDPQSCRSMMAKFFEASKKKSNDKGEA
jgi:hypothetical protein